MENPAKNNWEEPTRDLSMVGNGLNKEDKMKQTYSFRTAGWRYILYMNGLEELYHNKIDPFEWKNLAKDEEYSAKKEELKNEMQEIIQH